MLPQKRGLAVAFALVLGLAAVLRFVGLAWGLRHAPEGDERLFVESVAEMIRHHDLDQRFYEYPGLFFHLLRIPLTALSDDALGSSEAYLVSRRLVAGFGLVSVALAFALGRRLVSVRAGLFAALVVAVAPVEVATAHMVRPDVVLETCVLTFFLVLSRSGPEALRDTLSGLALGVATAVKPTGAFLFASFACDRGLRQGRRTLGLTLAGLAAAAVILATTPYLLMEPARFLRGFHDQWGYHFSPLGRTGYASFVLYMKTLAHGLGPAGCLFLAIGLWRARARALPWAPLLVFPLALIGALSSAQAHWPRLVLPTLGVLAVVAALGFEHMAERWPGGAWMLALGGSLVPLAASVSFVREVALPGTRDRAVAWIDRNLAAGSAVLTVDPTLGLDLDRFEVFHATGRADDDRLLGQTVDVVVASPSLPPLLSTKVPPVLVLPSTSTAIGPSLSLFLVPEPHPRPLALDSTMLEASSGSAALGATVDGRLDTGWRATEGDDERAWLQVTLARPERVALIELLLGDKPERTARSVVLSVSEDGTSWRSVPAAVSHTIVADPRKLRQVVAIEPSPIRRLRLTATSAPHHHWGVAELRVDAIP